MQQFQLLINLFFKVLDKSDPPLRMLLLCWKRYLSTVSSMSHTSWKIKHTTSYVIIKLKNLGQNLTWTQTPVLLNLSSSLRVNLFLVQPQKPQQDLTVSGNLNWTPTDEPLDPTHLLGFSQKVTPRPKLLLGHTVAEWKQPRLLIC